MSQDDFTPDLEKIATYPLRSLPYRKSMGNMSPQTTSLFADIHSASEEYARRFSGIGGAYLLDVQSSVVRTFVQHVMPHSLLDVGGGHGQIVSALSRMKIPITVLASAEEGLAHVRPYIEAQQCTPFIAHPLATGLPDKSADLVTCFRILPHCDGSPDEWRVLVKELCRVASRWVMVDYPRLWSVNLLSSSLFKVKKKYERSTRPFALFSQREVRREFAQHGFVSARSIHQFFFPMVIHRALGERWKTARISSCIEGVMRGLGATAVWGSPTIELFERGSAEASHLVQ